jgi:hypothetical protein
MKLLITLLDNAFFWLPALLGGLVDYFNQLIKGHKKWSKGGFFVHLSSALFFGWMCGSTADGLEHSPHIIAAAGGMGGFFGVRVADLLTYKLTGQRRG